MIDTSYNKFEISSRSDEIWYFINCDYEEYICDFEHIIYNSVNSILEAQEFNQKIYDVIWATVEDDLRKVLYFIVDQNILVQLHEEDVIKDIIWEIENQFRQMDKKFISTYDRQH